jgi:hypothetical protein
MSSLIFADYRELGRIEKYFWSPREPFEDAVTDIKELERAIDKEVIYGYIIIFLHDFKLLPTVNKLIDSQYVPILLYHLKEDHTAIIMVHTAVTAKDVSENLFRYLRKNLPDAIDNCAQGLILHDTFREYYSTRALMKQINHIKTLNGEIEYYSPLE